MSDYAVPVLIVAGEGPDTDPWHDLTATSAAAVQVFAALGGTRIRGSASVGAADLDGVRLVVMNVSHHGDPAPTVGTLSLIDEANRGGVAVLALHAAAFAFPGDERWDELIGGRWVHGTTFHPPLGEASFQVDTEHPAMRGAAGFSAYDERYSALATRTGNRRLAFHTEEGETHDLAWTRERPGRGPAAYWGPGHGVESYESAGHREHLAAVASWLIGGGGGR